MFAVAEEIDLKTSEVGDARPTRESGIKRGELKTQGTSTQLQARAPVSKRQRDTCIVDKMVRRSPRVLGHLDTPVERSTVGWQV